MYKLIILVSFVTIVSSQFSTTTVHIDVQELRCLVCKATLNELSIAIKKIDPARKVDVGGYRLDAEGNIKQKQVSQAKSEIHLSELADEVCERMDDYVRAAWKDTGKLTILKLIDANGRMNLDMSRVDIIQDDDLNKSLKYYCEGIVEEYEDNIIHHFKNDSDNIDFRVCSEEAKLCEESLPEPDDEDDDDEDRLIDEL